MAKAVEGGEKVSGVPIGDVPHWLLECDAWCAERQPLLCNHNSGSQQQKESGYVRLQEGKPLMVFVLSESTQLSLWKHPS